MTQIKRLKLQLGWDAVGRQEFSRSDLNKIIVKYVMDNFDYNLMEAIEVSQSFTYYYSIGCLVRVAPNTYKFDEEFFNKNVFLPID